MSRKPLIAGNWKLHKTLAETLDTLEALGAALGVSRESDPEVLVCPPFTALAVAVAAVAGTAIAIGAQNASEHASGAYTGEVSCGMIQDVGATSVILGHSERRALYGETDQVVNAKLKAALAAGLVPIVCVGETLAERESGETDAVVTRQLTAALAGLDASALAPLVVAYEPVWAIGTGKTCESAEANRVCGVIREAIARAASGERAAATRVLYGGSVKPETIAEQMAQPEIDGALVGGASLEAASFARIVRYSGVPA